MGRVLLFSIGLACAACSLFPDTAPRLEDDSGAGGVAGTTPGGGTGGTAGIGATSGGGSSGSGGSAGDAGDAGDAAGCGGQQALTLDAARDTYIGSSPPTANHGSKSILEVLTFTQSSGQRALVGFELSKGTLPAGAKLEKATLSLRVLLNEGATQDLGAHRLQKSWTEDGATWAKYDGSSNWLKNGGDFLPPSSQVAVGPNVKVGDTLGWDVTADVAGVLDGSLGNEGWLVKPLVDDPLDGEKLHFASREGTDPVARPKLELVYVICP
ncbi:MAG: DNRLRE domain-containing protein [Polyangiaceae bacterium]|nr:DNRLRE domain-containing protein [Polyangiaceae bacterium]MCE7890268.1 hypothetical protein [Sorangiineae bacterium PRO1]MCL4751204.1 DNRLRE domain-containing protein [Myxococcales bacterium]